MTYMNTYDIPFISSTCSIHVIESKPIHCPFHHFLNTLRYDCNKIRTIKHNEYQEHSMDTTWVSHESIWVNIPSSSNRPMSSPSFSSEALLSDRGAVEAEFRGARCGCQVSQLHLHSAQGCTTRLVWFRMISGWFGMFWDVLGPFWAIGNTLKYMKYKENIEIQLVYQLERLCYSTRPCNPLADSGLHVANGSEP